ncbi:hypothetical protein [Pseudoduganella flava]|uniref:Chemotaxis protein n=1 Tax=Pseudoduganella flava TaxID=871742 RepID=A0ABX6FUT8_9BURK|nr:hypothetical protein [Pseudoduganella flava]QGZ40327.1 hypothetical protein GO485_15550 [Pseudoduganella flava]
MRKKFELAVVLILAVATTVSTYVFFDRINSNFFTTFWGVIGTNLSVVGFVYTLYQIHQLRSEAEIIRVTADQTRGQLYNLNVYGELAKGVKLIQEIQGYTRGKKYETGVLRLQELKAVISIAQIQNARRSNPFDLIAVTRTLNQLINGMEKELTNSGNSFRANAANASLEEILDIVHQLQQDTLPRN